MLGKRIINTATGAAPSACTTDTVQILGDTSCIAYYKMSDATDETGSYDGTPTNVNFNVAGKFGNAGEFNGSSSYVLASSFMPTGSNQRSASAWVKTTISNANMTILFSGSESSNNAFIFRILNGQLGITFWGNDHDFTATGLTDGNWHHVVATYDGSAAKVYLDGNLIGTGSAGAVSTNSGNFAIGAYNNGVDALFNGSIDQVRIFNRAITANEVETLYDEVQCIPTIVPTDNFNPVLYTGNGGTKAVTGVGFAPDFTWIKQRSGGASHSLQDTVRGAGQSKNIYSDNTASEGTYGQFGYLSAFNTDGFTVVKGSGSHTNTSSSTYVSWNWKAGGPDVLNEEGTIDSQVSANTDAGFSIVSYAGNSATSATIGHGLDSAPEMVIIKARNNSAGWPTQHNGLYGLRLNDTGANNVGNGSSFFSNTPPNSSVFTVGGSDEVNDGYNYIAYCFHSVDGMSKIGSYVGNLSANGPTIVTGFRPAFLMIKRSDGTAGNWFIFDNKRSTSNERDDFLHPNLSAAETLNNASYAVDFLSNGFQIKGNGDQINANNGTHIFMAFAEENIQPQPVLANSFNTVLYTGNGGTQSITSLDFQPDLVWIKSRDNANFEHAIFDSVRGAGTSKVLSSNTTNAEGWTIAAPMTSFDSNGFTVEPRSDGNANNLVNKSGEALVAWCWKASNESTINNNGSIPSVVSANPAAGFSVVSYTGTGSVGSIGHGLSSAPELIIMKNRDGTNGWVVRSSALGNGYLLLNSSSAYSSTAFWGTPTDSVFSITSNSSGTLLNNKHIAYCFHSVDGYQKVGSYSGTGLTGNVINVGFKPQFILLKNTSSGTNGDGWFMFDTTRSGSDVINVNLQANTPDAESGPYAYTITVSDNGFEPTGSFANFTGTNASGNTYIYLAIA